MKKEIVAVKMITHAVKNISLQNGSLKRPVM